MALSWNEIKDRALKFSLEWENETKEHAEKDHSGMISLMYSVYQEEE